MRKALSFALLFVACSTGFAAERIGQAIPLTNVHPQVTSRLELGFSIAATEALQQEAAFTATLADSGCDEEAAKAAGKAFKTANVEIVIGPLCTLAAAAIAEIVKPVPVISIDTRNPLLQRQRDINKLALFELGQSANSEARGVVEHILPRFQGRPFALLDDGSVYGRGLSDTVRLEAEKNGLRPTEVSNFRPGQSNQKPLLRRLARSGIEAIFIAAPAEDAARIAQGVSDLGFDWLIATGEAGSLLPFADGAKDLVNGILAVFPSQAPEAAKRAMLERLAGQDAEVEDLLITAHALMNIAIDYKPKEALITQTFPTILGTVSFGEDGVATPLPFALYRWENGTFRQIAP